MAAALPPAGARGRRQLSFLGEPFFFFFVIFFCYWCVLVWFSNPQTDPLPTLREGAAGAPQVFVSLGLHESQELLTLGLQGVCTRKA